MGRKQIAVVCESCDSPLRSDSPFCPGCGKPTHWATHDERVSWEVRQWRTSRAREAPSNGTMILVRTEGGYEPVRVAAEQFVWDQPLHPEREQEKQQQQTPQRRATDPQVAATATESPPEQPTTIDADVPPAPPAPPPKPVAPMPFAATHAAPVTEPVHDESEARDVRISKKAVAVAIVLAVGLPLGSKMLAPSAGVSRSPSAKAAAGAIRPLALTSARSGFMQVSPDAVRFAVIVRNPNRRLAARETDVVVTFHDRTGRLIGSTVERIASVPAGGAIAVAGQAGVDGSVAGLRTRVSVAGFDAPSSANPFVVRGTTLSRTKNAVVVRMAVAARRAVAGARVIVVHFDRRGRILGGDFAYVDVPAMPRATRAAVSTSGLGAAVHHVEVYVLDPR